MLIVGLLAVMFASQEVTYDDVSFIPGDWEVQGSSSDKTLWLLTRPATGEGDRIWTRWEYPVLKPGPNGERSVRQLQDHDCQGGRVRVLQTTYFGEPNLRGRIIGEMAETSWVYVAPGTFDERTHALACASED